MNNRGFALTAFFLTFFTVVCFWEDSAQGRIIKIVVPEENRMEGGALFLWWPELPAIEWWQQDREASITRGSNVLVPLGADATRAEALIAAQAIEKKLTLCFNLGEFIFYQKRLLLEENDGAVEFVEGTAVTTGDGKKLPGFLFVHKKTGAFEHLFYGEEGNFYTIFSLQARDRKAYLRALHYYKLLLSRYREKW
ncbi:hypothetical protein CSB45_00980 [candidate division KSB3 bacterium]|uniref:Uncharacterized protein n=1 Tax=candidate division KSB3 bacterium TaxID=2044937 RepID=A0A2G6EBU0_9BACT|nr:MAG: hypothetical protein CSB45_00980 [candidate division KSB3 bacterium]